MKESEIQKIVVDYVRNRYHATVHGTANGTANGTHPPVGMLVGIPDLLVFESRGGYHGLCIELKTETGRLECVQEDVCKTLASLGYYVEVCYGLDAAIECIDRYFSMIGEIIPTHPAHFYSRHGG